MVDPDANEDAIRLKAYEIWELKGRTDGHDRDDWFQAELMLEPEPPSEVSNSTILDSIKDEVRVIAETAGKAVHYVEELLGIAPTGKPTK